MYHCATIYLCVYTKGHQKIVDECIRHTSIKLCATVFSCSHLSLFLYIFLFLYFLLILELYFISNLFLFQWVRLYFISPLFSPSSFNLLTLPTRSSLITLSLSSFSNLSLSLSLSLSFSLSSWLRFLFYVPTAFI